MQKKINKTQFQFLSICWIAVRRHIKVQWSRIFKRRRNRDWCCKILYMDVCGYSTKILEDCTVWRTRCSSVIMRYGVVKAIGCWINPMPNPALANTSYSDCGNTKWWQFRAVYFIVFYELNYVLCIVIEW